MKITKRQILAVVMIVGVSTIAGAGSFAYLSDSDTSEISFLTGSLEVNTAPSDGTLNFGDIAESSPTADVTIANDGSLPARQVLWTDLELSGDSAAAKATKIKKIEYRGENVTSEALTQVEDAGNGNGIYDLDDVSNHLDGDDIDLEAMVDGDGLSPDGDTAELAVTISVDYSQPGVTEDGMNVTASVEVTGHQQTAESTG